MRLLYLSADRGIPLDGHKGASVHVRQTVSALCGAGIDVTVASVRPGGGFETPAHLLPFRRRLRAVGPATQLEQEQAALANVAQLCRTAVESAPDAGYDAVYERYSLWSTAGLALSERFSAPLLLEINAPLVDEARRYRGLRLTGVAESIERSNLSGADALLCVSQPLCRRAVQRGAAASRVLHTPNPVDLSAFTPVRPSTGGDVTIAFLGSLKPWHGVLDLLEAFRLLVRRRPEARLLIIGDGPLRQQLETAAAEPSLEGRIELTGAVTHDEVPAELGRAQIAVAPYPRLENFYFSPIKLVEYCAAGLPVVATEIGDFAQKLEAGRDYLSTPPGDVESLALALERLVIEDGLRRHLGRRARQVAEESFCLHSSTERLVDLLQALTAESPARGIAG